MRRARGTIGTRRGRTGLWLRWVDAAGTRRLRRASSDDRQSAERELLELLAAEDAKTAHRPTFAGYVLAVYLPLHDAEVAASTASRTRQLLRRANAAIGHLAVQDVTPAHARELVASLRRLGLSDGTIVREVAAIRPVFALAIARGIIRSNPFAGGRFGLRLRHPRPRRPELMSAEAIDEMIAAAPWPHRLALVLAVDCGLRRGAIVALRWSSVTGTAILATPGPTAKRSVPAIPLTARARVALERMRPLTEPSGLVLGGLTANALRLWWGRFRAAHGLGRLRLHDLRHQFASRLVHEARAPDRVVADLLGHQDVRLVQTTYGTSVPSEAAAESVRALEAADARRHRRRPSRGGRRGTRG